MAAPPRAGRRKRQTPGFFFRGFPAHQCPPRQLQATVAPCTTHLPTSGGARGTQKQGGARPRRPHWPQLRLPRAAAFVFCPHASPQKVEPPTFSALVPAGGVLQLPPPPRATSPPPPRSPVPTRGCAPRQRLWGPGTCPAPRPEATRAAHPPPVRSASAGGTGEKPPPPLLPAPQRGGMGAAGSGAVPLDRALPASLPQWQGRLKIAPLDPARPFLVGGSHSPDRSNAPLHREGTSATLRHPYITFV